MNYKVESVVNGYLIQLAHPIEQQYLTRDHEIVEFLGGEDKGLGVLCQFRVFNNVLEEIGGFCLSPFPGNCGIAVSHYAYVCHNRQGIGHGKKLTEVREILAKELGYSVIMATVECTNIKQVAIMNKRGWKVDKTFYNARSEHNCFVWTKLL